MSGPQISVVVAFSSRDGATETRALTAALGSVNARALIRMRRMPDAPGTTEAGHPELGRMRREYVPPTEADLAGADALLVAVPPGRGADAPEWATLLGMLDRVAGQGALRGKIGGVVPGGRPEDDAVFEALLLAHGLVVVPSAAVAPTSEPTGVLAHARALGRYVAQISQALKAASP